MSESKEWATLSPEEFVHLLKYIDYSSKKVQDVLKEFYGDGELAQHLQGDSIDFEGFKLFMKIYLEAEISDTLCQRLFLSFQTSAGETPASGLVCVHDVSCYFSLLEGGRPEGVLLLLVAGGGAPRGSVRGGNGQGRVLPHGERARVGPGPGWPWGAGGGWRSEGLREMFRGGVNVFCREWSGQGNCNVCETLLVGLRKQGLCCTCEWGGPCSPPPRYCNVCETLLVGLRKQGLCCTFCKFTAHERCARQAPPSCISTYAKSRKDTSAQSHVWVKGGCEASKCDSCHKKIKSFQSLTGLHCVWCHLKIHEECQPSVPQTCDCGALRDHILPPSAIYPVVLVSESPPGTSPELLPRALWTGPCALIIPVPDTHPLLVFVNPKSGGENGGGVLRKFQYLLNPRQVYNLMKGGPAPGLNFFRDVPDFRILVCGGDGTVGWILDAIGELKLTDVPDFRILVCGGDGTVGWILDAIGYDGENLGKILKDIESSSVLLMDRWLVQVTPENPSEKGDPVPYEIINNYFSIGVDASIAHRFHLMREKCPEKFNSRMKNKLWYFEFATSETLFATCKKLKEYLTIEV
uniref:Diacylglycerol kinase n=1 Tax=Pelodiscus sinensis TaxID=13735 RepID=K7F567_PELSI